jgi:hypothetical protein
VHHAPHPSLYICARCGVADHVLHIWPGLPCKRRIAARYNRRFGVARRSCEKLVSGWAGRWSAMGMAALRAAQLVAELRTWQRERRQLARASTGRRLDASLN